MLRLFFAAFIASIYMCSCSSGTNEVDITLLKEVNNSLLRSNDATKLSTSDLTRSLVDKSKDPATSERATKWLGKALIINKLTDSVIQYINHVKSDLVEEAGFDPLENEKPASAKQAVDHIFKEHKEAGLLHEKLALYKKDLIAVVDDSVLQQHIKNIIVITGTDMISNENSFADRYFNTTLLGAITMLNKLENDIRLTEYKLTMLCFEQCPPTDDGFRSYKTIIEQTATVVKAGENMQITTGVGAYSIEVKPSFIIAGKEIPVNPEGFAAYNFRASSKPGTYRIPVQIKFFDLLLNKDVTVTENVEYTVRPDCP